MKLALIACLLAVSVISSEAYWSYGYGGLWGGLYGGLYGGLWNGYYGGLYGGWGYGYWGKRDAEMMPPQHLKNRTECVFLSSKKMLSCHGPESMLECPAMQTLPNTENYEMFGLGFYAGKSDMFRIIPRALDNSGWNTGLYDAEAMKYATLSTSDEFLGVKVTDVKCFDRMVETIFSASNRNEMTFVGGESVRVFGDLMIAKDLPEMVVTEKREEQEWNEEQMKREENWSEKREQDWTRRSEYMPEEKREWDMETRDAEYPYHGNQWTRRSEYMPEEKREWDMETRDAEYPYHGNQWTRRSEYMPEERREWDMDMETRDAEYPYHGNHWTRRSEYMPEERREWTNKREEDMFRY